MWSIQQAIVFAVASLALLGIARAYPSGPGLCTVSPNQMTFNMGAAIADNSKGGFWISLQNEEGEEVTSIAQGDSVNITIDSEHVNAINGFLLTANDNCIGEFTTTGSFTNIPDGGFGPVAVCSNSNGKGHVGHTNNAFKELPLVFRYKAPSKDVDITFDFMVVVGSMTNWFALQGKDLMIGEGTPSGGSPLCTHGDGNTSISIRRTDSPADDHDRSNFDSTSEDDNNDDSFAVHQNAANWLMGIGAMTAAAVVLL